MGLNKNHIPEAAGWIGMILVQCATVPTAVSNIMGWSHQLPPLSMVLLVWSGLMFYFIRAFAQRDVLYMTSNGIGFVLNTILLALIVYPNY